MKMFNTVTDEEILNGSVTDSYFERTEEALDAAEKNPVVVADVSADQFTGENYEVLAGLDEASKLLAKISEELTVWSLPEGALFNGGPVLRIKGRYKEFAKYETALLGFLSHASGIATNALEITTLAEKENADVFSFGSRHVHPGIATVVERSALIGGVDGFSNVVAGQRLDRQASGTMPHALMICFGKGNQEEAWRAFHEGVPDDVPRSILCDTFTDEKDEVLRAIDTLGDNIDSIRLDTTGSRRGDFRHIIKEVKWAVELLDRDDIDIIVSGGLGPKDVKELGDIVDAFGIGSYISNAEPIDFSLDIVQLDGEPIAKRGKNAGLKKITRTYSKDDKASLTKEMKQATEPGDGQFQKIIENGEVLHDFTVESARNTARTERLLFSEPPVNQ